MAFGRKSAIPAGKLFVVRIKTKDEDDKELLPAVFQISQKDEATAKWTKIDKTEQTISGDLFKVEIGKGEWDGKPYKTVKLYLNDSDLNENYLIDLRYMSLSRNLFNALLNLKTYKGISVSLYKSKGKPKDGQPAKEYSNISVWQNDQLIKTKYKSDEMPKADEITNKKGEVIQRDYTELNDFLENELKTLAENVSAAAKNKTTSVAKAAVSEVENESVPDTELPEDTVLF